MNKLLYIMVLLLVVNILNAESLKELAKAICIILQDENSIICKYSHERQDEQREVKFEWVEPSGNTTRIRNMIIPAGHGSIYDYRYIKGRTKGTWIFKVTDDTEQTQTKFIVE